METTTFLGALFGLAALILVLFLYISRKWCFHRKHGGFPCCDENNTLPSKYIHKMGKCSCVFTICAECVPVGCYLDRSCGQHAVNTPETYPHIIFVTVFMIIIGGHGLVVRTCRRSVWKQARLNCVCVRVYARHMFDSNSGDTRSKHIPHAHILYSMKPPSPFHPWEA